MEKQQHTLLELIDYHNTHLKDTLEWGTLKNYFTTQNYVKEFLTERLRKKDIYLSQLSYRFITEFEMFLKGYQPKDHRKPMGNNTVMKHIERLRKMIDLAIKNEWLEKDPFHKFKLKFEKKDRGYLTKEELISAIAKADDGDIIELSAGQFTISSPLEIVKKLTIQSADTHNKSIISYTGAPETPAFEMNPNGELILNDVVLQGNGKNYAFASLKENMSSLYNLEVNNVEVTNFDFVLKTYKYSFSEYIQFNAVIIKNCNNGLELSGEDDDRGEYNAENVFIIDSRFDDVSKNVIDYYRGRYDESTVGGNLLVKGCTFTNSGADEENGILINTYGIINVDISGNIFKNNPVELVARLWGAKNNSHSNNVIENSGSLIVEENLPLKRMY